MQAIQLKKMIAKKEAARKDRQNNAQKMLL